MKTVLLLLKLTLFLFLLSFNQAFSLIIQPLIQTEAALISVQITESLTGISLFPNQASYLVFEKINGIEKMT